jgi:hypothetical protein
MISLLFEIVIVPCVNSEPVTIFLKWILPVRIEEEREEISSFNEIVIFVSVVFQNSPSEVASKDSFNACFQRKMSFDVFELKT